MWEKTGNFQNSFDSGGGSSLNRQVRYTHSASTAAIKELSLYGYTDGDFQVVVRASNAQSFEQLIQSILSAGFPQPDFLARTTNTYRLSANNLIAITHVIKAVKMTQPDFTEIEGDACGALGINLTQEERLPAWISSGNFHNTHEMGADLNRQKIYTCLNGSAIKELKLFGYRDGDVTIYLSMDSRTQLENLKSALLSIGLQTEGNNNEIKIQLKYAANRLERLAPLLTILGEFSSSFNEISNQIQTEIDCVSRLEHPRNQSNSRELFHRESIHIASVPSTALPPQRLRSVPSETTTRTASTFRTERHRLGSFQEDVLAVIAQGTIDIANLVTVNLHTQRGRPIIFSRDERLLTHRENQHPDWGLQQQEQAILDSTVEALREHSVTLELIRTHWRARSNGAPGGRCFFDAFDKNAFIFLVLGQPPEPDFVMSRGMPPLPTQYRLQPIQALREISELDHHQLRALMFFYERGLRSAQLRNWSPRFDMGHIEALKTLVFEQNQSVDAAITELRGLADNQAWGIVRAHNRAAEERRSTTNNTASNILNPAATQRALFASNQSRIANAPPIENHKHYHADQLKTLCGSLELREIGYQLPAIPDEWICPISCQLIDDPVYSGGSPHPYEKNYLLRWLKIRSVDPIIPSAKVDANALVPAIGVKQKIESFLKEQQSRKDFFEYCLIRGISPQEYASRYYEFTLFQSAKNSLMDETQPDPYHAWAIVPFR